MPSSFAPRLPKCLPAEMLSVPGTPGPLKRTATQQRSGIHALKMPLRAANPGAENGCVRLATDFDRKESQNKAFELQGFCPAFLCIL